MRARTLGRAAGVVAGTGAATLGYGLWEARQFTLRRVDVPLLPAGQAPIRVLHLSDIHLLPRQRHKLEWISRLAGLEPDLVVNTGDNFCSPDAIAPLLDAWGRLLDVPGVFVFGSNDYRMPKFKNPAQYLAGPSNVKKTATPELPYDDLRAAMTSRGWLDLNHQRGELQVAGRRLAFRGTDDAHLGKDDYSLVAGPPVEGADLNIGVTHAPYLRLLDAFAADGMDMVFAGHTHGGQVCLPVKGALVTNCDLDTARVKGLSSHTARTAADDGWHTSWLHVSAGLGSSPFAPYRVACRPEATLLTLVAR